MYQRPPQSSSSTATASATVICRGRVVRVGGEAKATATAVRTDASQELART